MCEAFPGDVAGAAPGAGRRRTPGFRLPVILRGYPAGMKLCNTWVLSCQHQLQILAWREADRSEFIEMLCSFTCVDG